MLRFITRRLLHLIPTVLGVIVITFILFNLVGGSPGRMALGEKASAEQVDAFDEKSGFNKPVLYGSRIKTLAFHDHDFQRNAGPWSAITSGVSYVAANARERAYLKCTVVPSPPLAFDLREDSAYEWTAKWRNAGEPWKKSSARFETGSTATNLATLFAGAKAEFEIADLKLRRVVANPLDSQLWNYLKSIAFLDFGTSTAANLPVSQLLKDGIVPTMMLATPILVIELVVAVSLGLLCAYFRGRFFDRAMVFVSVALMSINYLVWIVVGQYLLAYKAQMFPVWGFESWTYLALPVLIGVVSGFGGDVRFYRTVMLDEIYKDYVRTAFAKGVSTRDVLFKHVLRNAAVPIVTNVILAIPFLYTGSLLLESYFGIPGVGYLSFNAINSSDPAVIRAVVLIGSVLYVLCGLIGDLLAAWFDPRIKLT